MTPKKRGSKAFLNSRKAVEHELFFNIFELVLVVIVAFALFNFVKSIEKDTLFQKTYLARDVALVVNTLYAAPGDVSYTYVENGHDNTYNIDFAENTVSVSSAEDKDGSVVPFYHFDEDKNLKFIYNFVENNKGIVSADFSKSQDRINVEKSEITSKKPQGKTT